MKIEITLRRNIKRGALIGLIIGLTVLAGLMAISVHCLPYRISSPTQPWPWVCADPLYPALGYLAFPINVLTNDLSRALVLAPLSLGIYAFLGALIGAGLHHARRIHGKG